MSDKEGKQINAFLEGIITPTVYCAMYVALEVRVGSDSLTTTPNFTSLNVQ